MDLEQRFGQSDGTKFFQVKKDLYSISQGNQDIAVYFTEIKRLWDEHDSMIAIPTCACGTECATYKYDQQMREKDKLIQLLVGLNDVYKGVRGNILMSRRLPNVSEAYYMLLQEEHQREMSSEVQIVPQSAALYNSSYNSQEPLGLMGKNVGYTDMRSGGYNGSSNSYSNNRNQNGSNGGNNHLANYRNPTSKRPLFCEHCKMTGHTIQRCYKIHSYPRGHRSYRGKKLAASVTQEQEGVSWLEDVHNSSSAQEPALSLPTLNSEQYQQLLSLLSKQQAEGNTPGTSRTSVGTGFMTGKHFSFLISFSNGDWIIDSGASDHITPNLDLLKSARN